LDDKTGRVGGCIGWISIYRICSLSRSLISYTPLWLPCLNKCTYAEILSGERNGAEFHVCCLRVKGSLRQSSPVKNHYSSSLACRNKIAGCPSHLLSILKAASTTTDRWQTPKISQSSSTPTTKRCLSQSVLSETCEHSNLILSGTLLAHRVSSILFVRPLHLTLD